jgi:hypothetical protein
MIPAYVVGVWQRQYALAEQARLRREIAAERVRQALEAMRVT